MSFILNFHGIGKPERPFEENEDPYWISQDQFIAILDNIEQRDVHITFDDGNDSDALIAAPILSQRGLKADFFVLAGKIGRKGYLSETQIKRLEGDPLFSIGSHGMDHRAWTDIDDAALSYEVKTSQNRLSQLCGRMVDSAGLPFGRYNRRVLKALKIAGYNSVYSSDGSPKLSSVSPIPRFSIRNDTDIPQLENDIDNNQAMIKRLKNEAKIGLKALL